MSERQHGDGNSTVLIGLLLGMLFAVVIIGLSELRDLQRRVGQLESREVGR